MRSVVCLVVNFIPWFSVHHKCTVDERSEQFILSPLDVVFWFRPKLEQYSTDYIYSFIDDADNNDDDGDTVLMMMLMMVAMMMMVMIMLDINQNIWTI